MIGLLSASPVDVQEAHEYNCAIQVCNTDFYWTLVTSSYCVSYRRLAIKLLIELGRLHGDWTSTNVAGACQTRVPSTLGCRFPYDRWHVRATDDIAVSRHEGRSTDETNTHCTLTARQHSGARRTYTLPIDNSLTA